MKITIITVCYNRESTIRDAIESVLAQDYDDIEYIIIDGLSKDKTMDIVNEYRGRVTHIISEMDRGMYEAINKGIRMATGDYIGLVHSDDMLISPHTISHIAQRLTETGADLLYADGIYVDRNDLNKVKRVWRGGNFTRRKLSFGWLPLHTTVYMRKDIILKCGLYDERYEISADTKFLIKCLCHKDIHITYLPETVIRMRMGGLSTTWAHISHVWAEDILLYRQFGFKHPYILKFLKMAWKIPQYISALFY
ncbi:MAG: glycosyltransferase [Bacteroidaceae bacterium]|nr:glycosyltransferase [Bacteroidaceae bacterium]